MENFKAESQLCALCAKFDNNVISLWLETAGLAVFLSAAFLLMLKVF